MSKDQSVTKVSKKAPKEVQFKKRPVRRFIASFFQVKRWIALNEIKSYGGVVKAGVKQILKHREGSEREETFTQAVRRLKLSEQDLQQRTTQFLRLTWLYVSLAVIFLAYAIYLICTGSFLAMFISLALAFFLLANALREHFWYMQTRLRKLGCNFHDWFNFVSGKSK